MTPPSAYEADTSPASLGRKDKRPVCLCRPRFIQSAATPDAPSKDPARMRMSQYFLPTLKENPAEAQILSHPLRLLAGLVLQPTPASHPRLPPAFHVLNPIHSL